MMERSRHRLTPQIHPEKHYGFNITENYYPVTGAISIHDNKTKKQVILYTDRTQGATSLKNGQIEVMVNRRIQSRDSKGIGEPLNEIDFKTRKGIDTNHTYFLQIKNNV
jgi:hypothetical protein